MGFPMSVNYEYYRIFYYVAKFKSFTQAANALANSQPNITRSIKNLEQELGCSLFTRSNRQVQLTPEGEALYRHVSIAFHHLLAGEDEIAKGKGLDGGVVRIAATEIALHTVLLPVLKDFKFQHPSVHIKLMNDSTPSAIADLQNGLADIAVVTTPVSIPESIRKTQITSFREVAICGSAYEQLARETVTLAKLTHFPIISLGEQTGTYRFYAKLFADNGLVFEPDIEAATADQILPMVRANLGIGFVPETFLQKDELGRAIFEFNLLEQIPSRAVCLLTPAARPIGPAARALAATLTI